jgi:hypothetical protein
MTDQTTEAAAHAAALAAAEAAVTEQTYALVQAAGRHRDLGVPEAARTMMRELLADQANNRDALAAAVAVLAVAGDRGDIGTPFGMLAIPAATVLAAMVALYDVDCQFGMCQGPTLKPIDMVTCRRCSALALLEDATGLNAQDVAR